MDDCFLGLSTGPCLFPPSQDLGSLLVSRVPRPSLPLSFKPFSLCPYQAFEALGDPFQSQWFLPGRPKPVSQEVRLLLPGVDQCWRLPETPNLLAGSVGTVSAERRCPGLAFSWTSPACQPGLAYCSCCSAALTSEGVSVSQDWGIVVERRSQMLAHSWKSQSRARNCVQLPLSGTDR